MPMKIATWNLCLGLFHKKDYVRSLLHDNNIDILTLQETELADDIDVINLQIKGYSFEVETNDIKRRIAVYVRNTIAYKRRFDLEKTNLHTIVLDVGTTLVTRIITIYRTFTPQNKSTPRENFREQLNVINNATTNSTILLGDFNLDDQKRYLVNYGQRLLFQDFEEIVGHHQFTQHVKEPTWERVIENRTKNSVIDHIYCTDSTKVGDVLYKNTSFGDHRLVILCTSDSALNEKLELQRRNWKYYSDTRLVDMLKSVEWQTEIETVQDMWNSYEKAILTVTDSIAPLEEINNSTIKAKKSPLLKKHQNRRNYLLKKRKRTGPNENEKKELSSLNKFIRNYHYQERKQNIRRKIKPGNSKSLWDAVKIAKDVEPTHLPSEMFKDGICYNREKMSTAFADHFINKVSALEADLKISEGVYNGSKMLNSTEFNFMTEVAVNSCLNELKTKNCEGFDRIPMRILKDGAPILAKPLSVLFQKIYTTKKIPEQWKIAKIIPLHKKGKKQDMANYRPISNLCSTSKVFEKLILKRLEMIEEENKLDLTGKHQHGFKKNRSTITAGLTLQSIISKALDEDEYAVMASLDLSAAFDLVNLDLLITRLKIMGIPKDVMELLEIWLRDRYLYVEANGKNSIIFNTNIGTIQGSILGPILYALFIRPIYDFEKITTFADDNYVVERNQNKECALKELGRRLERIVKWLKDSGLKVNESKTELCIFHRNKNTEGTLKIDNTVVISKNEMNVLGLTFDSRLNWAPQVSRAIKSANISLQAIRMINKYFTTPEIVQLLTSYFYSKLYYGSEIWQIPKLNQNCKKQLLTASANALKLCDKIYNPNISYVDLHKKFNRALPDKFYMYRHCLLLFKVFNNMIPRKDWLDLNFQMINTSRQKFFEVQNNSVYKVGNNILSNRLSCLNKKIELDILNLPIKSYKIHCKKMFLL